MKAGRRPTAKTVKDYFASGSGRKLWKEGQAEKENVGNGLGEFDDGKYRVKLTKAYTAMSNTSGRPQNVLTFKFMEGEYKGQLVSQYQGLDNKMGIAIALQTLAKLGHEIDSPDEIDDADKKLGKEQPEVEVRLRTRGEYQNVLISALIGGSNEETEEEEEDADVETEDDDEDETPKSKTSKPSKSDAEDVDNEDADSEDDDDDDKDTDEEADDDDDEDEEDDDEDEEKETKPSKKSDDKKSKKSDDDDEEDEEEEEDDKDEDEEEVALEPGMRLKVKHDGETVKAKIVKVDEKAREVKVKLADGSKITISVDDIIDVL